MEQEKPRDRILSTASRLFFTQGYSQTGINQIIGESNVSKDTLYRHFQSKEDVVIAYIKAARVEWFEKFNHHLSKSSTNSAKIISAFDLLANSMINNEFKGCRFLNLLADIEITSEVARQEIVAHKEQLRATFVSLFSLIENSQLTITEREELGNITYLLFEGAIVESKVFKDIWPILKAKNMVSKLLDS